MTRRFGLVLLPALLGLALTLAPAPARAAENVESCSNIMCRIWVMFYDTAATRTQSQVPLVTRFMEGAEKLFLGGTIDMTQEAAIKDIFGAMRAVGVLILAFCFVFSLAELSMAPMLGHHFTLVNWFWRLCVATVMTFGSLPLYGAMIRFGNYCVHVLREYLAAHWIGTLDPSGVYSYLLSSVRMPNDGLLILIIIAEFLLVNIVLWFLLGGIRTAEIGLHIILAPFVWPLYLIPSLDDIPKTAFRGFLVYNFLLLFVVAMVRTAARLVTSGNLGQTVWAFIPAIAFLGMSLFLPAALKRIFGQGHTGISAVTTAVSMLAGLKGLQMMAASGAGTAGAAPAAPAAATATAPVGPNPYPIAPAAPAGGMAASSYGGGAGSTGALDLPTYWQYREHPMTQVAAGRIPMAPLQLEQPLRPTDPGVYVDCPVVPRPDGSLETKPGGLRFDEKLLGSAWMPGKGVWY